MNSRIEVKVGDIFESRAQALVNTVNTVGVMGKGIALGFRRRFPKMYDDYVDRCNRGEVLLGRPYIYKSAVPPWIINFPTKEHWRSAARLDAIVEGLEHLKREYRNWGVESLAVPPLGCGEGRLDWHVVGPTLYRHLSLLNIPVELYAPYETPASELTDAFLTRSPVAATAVGHSRSPVEPSHIALAEILRRIEREPYHYPVGHVTFQKLAYFATVRGIPTGLKFNRSSFGPFASDLKGVTSQLVNNGLIREEPQGSMIRVLPGPSLSDARERFAPDLLGWEREIDQVTDLLARMPGREAEVAATVHFAATELLARLGKTPSETEVVGDVLTWKARRKPALTALAVAQTVRRLNLLGWIKARVARELPVSTEVA